MRQLGKVALVRSALLLVAMVFLVIAGPAGAEPVAPMPRMNKEGRKLLKMQNKTMQDVEREIPSKEAVGVPIYPGALFASHTKSQSEGLLPSISLVASDPPEKVKSWYKEALKGWTYSETFMLFHDGEGEVTFSELFERQSVNVMAEEGPALDLMFSEVPEVKTRIQIIYKPQK